jgi:hypothetical protein
VCAPQVPNCPLCRKKVEGVGTLTFRIKVQHAKQRVRQVVSDQKNQQFLCVFVVALIASVVFHLVRK